MRRCSLEWAFDDKFLVLDLVVILVKKRLQLKIALLVTEATEISVRFRVQLFVATSVRFGKKLAEMFWH